MAGNLGYDVSFVLDATHSFDRADVDGQIIPADQMYRTTAANLNREFATIVATRDLVS
jgi:nicotinamidase-related amidase